MKLSERVDKIETALVAHLKESGEIRSDINSLKEFANDAKDLPADMKWVKRAFWTLVTLTITSLVAVFCAWIRAH